jgi:hypothetical protein
MTSNLKSWVVLAIAIGGCGGSRPRGGPDDIHSVARQAAGYRVVPCQNDIGVEVIGTGRHAFPWVIDFEDEAAREAFRREAVGAAGARSLIASGFGAGCIPGRAAFRVWTSSYRDVDVIVERLGPWLARRNYQGIIFVSVMGLPQPLTI